MGKRRFRIKFFSKHKKIVKCDGNGYDFSCKNHEEEEIYRTVKCKPLLTLQDFGKAKKMIICLGQSNVSSLCVAFYHYPNGALLLKIPISDIFTKQTKLKCK